MVPKVAITHRVMATFGALSWGAYRSSSRRSVMATLNALITAKRDGYFERAHHDGA